MALFQEFAAALQFPWYFGENWDALNECINDLEWLPTKSYVLLVSHVDAVLPESSKEFHIFAEILSGAAATWWSPDPASSEHDRHRTVFRVIFHCCPEKEGAAKERLQRAGVSFGFFALHRYA